MCSVCDISHFLSVYNNNNNNDDNNNKNNNNNGRISRAPFYVKHAQLR